MIDGQVNKEMFQAYTDLFTQTAEQAQQAQQERLLAIQAAIENLSGGNGAIDIDELISKLPNYSDILNDIRNAMGDLVTKEDLDKYGQDHRVDLTTTNALLETINTTIQNKNFTGEFSEQLNNLSDIMNQVLGEIQSGNITEAEGLAKILEKLASMEGSLEAIQAASEELNNNFKTFMGEAKNYGQKWTEQFQKLIDGQVNKEMFEAYTDLFTEKAEQAEQAQQARIASVIAAIENISGGNGSVNIDELISKLPNYTDLLTEIRNAIGNLVTKDDLEQYGKDHSVDLTTTNALSLPKKPLNTFWKITAASY